MKASILENVKKQGDYLKEKLNKLKERYEIIIDVRGMGLMQGIELSLPVADIINQCIKSGLLLVGAGSQVIRFVPPLIVDKNEIDEAINILENVLKEV